MISASKAHTEAQIICIALDAMGGDNAPHAVIEGAALFLENFPACKVVFKIFGDSDKIRSLIEKSVRLSSVSEIIHTSVFVQADEKPSVAIRRGKHSSLQLAINAIKEREADAVVSAGNTGALMAMSTLTLRTLSGISRPAIIATLPTTKGQIAMLDLGANIEATEQNLYQFAVMGSAFAKIVLRIHNPKIGLLNIGSEEIKGKDSVKAAYHLIKNGSMNFVGYIEGDQIGAGDVDVIVTDGFTGNVMLKTIEGYVKVYKYFVKKAFARNILSKLQYLLALTTFKYLGSSLDARRYNGAMLVGVNGIVVKSHGSMDEVGLCHAIKVAYDLAVEKINDKITAELQSKVTEEVS